MKIEPDEPSDGEMALFFIGLSFCIVFLSVTVTFFGYVMLYDLRFIVTILTPQLGMWTETIY